jgi:hypothetical protein
MCTSGEIVLDYDDITSSQWQNLDKYWQISPLSVLVKLTLKGKLSLRPWQRTELNDYSLQWQS